MTPMAPNHSDLRRRPALCIAIPARFASTRLPGKPLLHIGAQTMIEMVALKAAEIAHQAQKTFAGLLGDVSVVVATDDERIATSVRSVGVEAVLTPSDLISGTDRIAAALAIKTPYSPDNADDLIINIQGDEPFLSQRDVLALCERMLERPDLPMGTMAYPRRSLELFLSSSVVKVVTDRYGQALYFSRAPVPWPRGLLGASGKDWQEKLESLETSPVDDVDFLHHMGLYAYRRRALVTFAQEMAPSQLELHEGLEQLRALEAGWKIAVTIAQDEPFGVDTFADLERARQRLFHGGTQ